MQALLERIMPVDYKTLHTVKSLALRIAGGQVRAAGQHRDQTEPHATRARDAACARCKIFFHGGRIEIPSMYQQSLRSVALSHFDIDIKIFFSEIIVKSIFDCLIKHLIFPNIIRKFPNIIRKK